MRLSVNHVAEIYVTEQRQRARVEKSFFLFVFHLL